MMLMPKILEQIRWRVDYAVLPRHRDKGYQVQFGCSEARFRRLLEVVDESGCSVKIRDCCLDGRCDTVLTIPYHRAEAFLQGLALQSRGLVADSDLFRSVRALVAVKPNGMVDTRGRSASELLDEIEAAISEAANGDPLLEEFRETLNPRGIGWSRTAGAALRRLAGLLAHLESQ